MADDLHLVRTAAPGTATTPESKAELIGWEPELAELRQRQALARELGGAERVARQHAGGRMTVRERIDACSTPAASWKSAASPARRPTTPRATSPASRPANCVFGRGTLDGRPVVVAGDDFTLRGGSADASIKGKPKMSEQTGDPLPHADHPADRGLRRRRLGEND